EACPVGGQGGALGHAAALALSPGGGGAGAEERPVPVGQEHGVERGGVVSHPGLLSASQCTICCSVTCRLSAVGGGGRHGGGVAAGEDQVAAEAGVPDVGREPDVLTGLDVAAFVAGHELDGVGVELAGGEVGGALLEDGVAVGDVLLFGGFAGVVVGDGGGGAAAPGDAGREAVLARELL